MIRFFPDSALVQLEFEKIKQQLVEHCSTEYGRSKAAELRIHTRKEYIDTELRQTDEYKSIVNGGVYFPNDYILNLHKELKLLGISGAVLTEDNFNIRDRIINRSDFIS